MKLSTGKRILPGRKQVFRVEEEGRPVRDLVAGRDEDAPGRPLLRQVMEKGHRVGAGREDLEAARERARRETAALPDALRGLARADPPYPVEVSRALRERQDAIQAALRGDGAGPERS